MEKFADVLDVAEALREAEVQSALANRKEYSSGIKPSGFCNYCESELDNPKQLFCDSKCSLKWSKLNER
jgi:hypothetical protein